MRHSLASEHNPRKRILPAALVMGGLLLTGCSSPGSFFKHSQQPKQATSNPSDPNTMLINQKQSIALNAKARAAVMAALDFYEQDAKQAPTACAETAPDCWTRGFTADADSFGLNTKAISEDNSLTFSRPLGLDDGSIVVMDAKGASETPSKNFEFKVELANQADALPTFTIDTLEAYLQEPTTGFTAVTETLLPDTSIASLSPSNQLTISLGEQNNQDNQSASLSQPHGAYAWAGKMLGDMSEDQFEWFLN